MPLNKPTIGQTGWGSVLNDALDYLDAKESSSADIADFEFEVVDDDGEFSRVTVANHDMVIRTTRTESQDADIDIDSADDVWITANGDDIHLSAADDVEITTNNGQNNSYNWEFNNSGGLKFPDGTIQTTAYTGGAGGDLVVPAAIKDTNGDDLITFEVTGTGTARIGTPQDDLSLRSARDITLFAGSEGPGNVYIGWGDAEITPNSNNRVATIGDVQSLTSGDFVFDDATMYTQVDGDTFIQARDDEGKTSAELVFDPGNDRTYLRAYGNFSQDTYYDTDWATATWTAGEGESSSLALTGASTVFTFLDNDFRQYNRKISINGSPLGIIDGWGGDGTDGSLYIIGIEATSDPITSITFHSSRGSTFEIDYDDDEMNITAQGLDIFIETTAGSDVVIDAGDNINLQAADDIQFRSNADSEQQHNWSMNSEGNFTLPGNGYISNPSDSSGDGNQYDTIKIVPDDEREEYDQYLIIDPTSPNHIHIRAGGTPDGSNADLIFGAERTNVLISDGSGQVSVSSKTVPDIEIVENISSEPGNTLSVNADLTYLLNSERPGTNFVLESNIRYEITSWGVNEGVTNIVAGDYTFTPNFFYGVGRDYGDLGWTFSNDGYLYGPADGALAIQGLLGPSGDIDLEVIAPTALVLNGQFGEFLDSSEDPNNQIATIGDLPTGATGSFVSQDGKTVTVTNGIITSIV